MFYGTVSTGAAWARGSIYAPMTPSSWAAFGFLPHFLFETVRGGLRGALHTTISSESSLSDEEVPLLLSSLSKFPHGCLSSRSDSLRDSQLIIKPRTGSAVSAEQL